MPYMNRIECPAIQCYPLLRTHLLQSQLHRVRPVALHTQFFQLRCHRIHEFANSFTSRRRDSKERLVIFLSTALYRLQALRLVERVDLRRHYELRPRRQLLIIGSQLVVNGFVIAGGFSARHRRNIDQVQQQLRALDVSQKTIAQTRACMSSFDQSRYVGNDEGTKVTEIHYTQMRFQSGERIIRNLWTRRRHRRNKRRLARVWKTHQTNISEQLQLELQVQLLSLASGLMVARSAI